MPCEPTKKTAIMTGSGPICNDLIKREFSSDEHEKERLICDHCGFIAKNKSGFLSHMRKHNKENV